MPTEIPGSTKRREVLPSISKIPEISL